MYIALQTKSVQNYERGETYQQKNGNVNIPFGISYENGPGLPKSKSNLATGINVII